MYIKFTCMPGESYRRRLRSLLLYLCYVFRALIDSLVLILLLGGGGGGVGGGGRNLDPL